MPLAKARFEGIAKVKNNFTRLKPPNTAACNFYNADKGNSEGKVGTHMDVAKMRCAYAVLQLLAFLLHACSLQPAWLREYRAIR